MIIGRMAQYSKGGGLETHHPRRQNAAHGFARLKLAFSPRGSGSIGSLSATEWPVSVRSPGAMTRCRLVGRCFSVLGWLQFLEFPI